MYFVLVQNNHLFSVSIKDIVDAVSFMQDEQTKVTINEYPEEEALRTLCTKIENVKEMDAEIYSMTGDVFECEMAEDGDMYSFLLKRNNDFLTIGLQEVLLCLRIAELSGKIDPISDFWQFSNIYPALGELFTDSKAEEMLMSKYWKKKGFSKS